MIEGCLVQSVRGVAFGVVGAERSSTQEDGETRKSIFIVSTQKLRPFVGNLLCFKATFVVILVLHRRSTRTVVKSPGRLLPHHVSAGGL